MRCPNCDYNEQAADFEGWVVAQVDEMPNGDRVDAWFCPVCDTEVCRCGGDCPPDEFGQVC